MTVRPLSETLEATVSSYSKSLASSGLGGWRRHYVGAHEKMCAYRAGLTVAPSQKPTFFPSGWYQAGPMTSPGLQRGSSGTGSSSSPKTACQWSFKQRLQEGANSLLCLSLHVVQLSQRIFKWDRHHALWGGGGLLFFNLKSLIRLKHAAEVWLHPSYYVTECHTDNHVTLLMFFSFFFATANPHFFAPAGIYCSGIKRNIDILRIKATLNPQSHIGCCYKIQKNLAK